MTLELWLALGWIVAFLGWFAAGWLAIQANRAEDALEDRTDALGLVTRERDEFRSALNNIREELDNVA